MREETSKLSVQPVASRMQQRDWLDVPHKILKTDPNWVTPLDLVERRRVSAKHSAFFTFGEVERFIAYRGATAVGRISAQVNRRHLERYQDATGQFGFFDCIDDPAVAAALLDQAGAWLAARGMKRMTGPFSLSINEETGVLVDGFETPPAILMPHGAKWYGPRLTDAGCTAVMDVYAYRFRPAETPEHLRRLTKLARTNSRLSVRKFDMRHYNREIDLLINIFNDAWSENWGFLPFSDAEIASLVAETRHILRDGWGRFLLLDGEPAGFMFALPDINRVIAPFDGRLLPLNWWTLARKFWRNDWETVRIPLMGLRKVHQSGPFATSMLAMLVAEFIEEARNYPIEWIEFSWVLDSNRPMRRLAEFATGKPPAKTYRIYQRALT